MTHSPDRLTPEERELASRLSRMGPHGEPPAKLDARILSAAHAAVAVPHARRTPWPALLGVAATLMLAIGVTWQLRPRPDASPELQEGPAATTEVKAMGEAADAAAAAASAELTVAPPSRTGAPPAPPAPSEARRVAPQAMARPPEEPPAVLQAQEAAHVAEPPSFAPAPAPVAAPTPVMVPSPPPPPPAPKAVATPSPEQVIVTGSARTAERAASAPPAAAAVQTQRALPRIEGHEARDVPIQEDTQLGAGDWLERIRLRRAADDVAGARASLLLFRRYYPDHAIPEDLAPLAQ